MRSAPAFQAISRAWSGGIVAKRETAAIRSTARPLDCRSWIVAKRETPAIRSDPHRLGADRNIVAKRETAAIRSQVDTGSNQEFIVAKRETAAIRGAQPGSAIPATIVVKRDGRNPQLHPSEVQRRGQHKEAGGFNPQECAVIPYIDLGLGPELARDGGYRSNVCAHGADSGVAAASGKTTSSMKAFAPPGIASAASATTRPRSGAT